jgi:hypothetical protein
MLAYEGTSWPAKRIENRANGRLGERPGLVHFVRRRDELFPGRRNPAKEWRKDVGFGAPPVLRETRNLRIQRAM